MNRPTMEADGPLRKTAAGKSLAGYYARRLLCLLISLLVAGCLAEGVFWLLEKKTHWNDRYEGEGGRLIADSRWGWKLSPGRYRIVTPEFDARGDVNALGMNSPAAAAAADRTRTRILAIGDSHTFAVGVDREANWVSQLEQKLNRGLGKARFSAYNAAVPAYNVHQYLLRLIDQGPIVKPDYVLVGFSYATDLYDLLPPGRGGSFDLAATDADYFDFDDAGQLVERHWKGTPGATASKPNNATAVRLFLTHFATYRYLRRSVFAIWAGSHLRLGGQSLWPNMDVILEKQVSPEHAYQWRLLEALLLRMQQECRRQQATMIVVGIPYLPQVYDEIWKATFGNNAKYSRTAAITRLGGWCRAHQIAYVDTCEALRAKVQELGRWLHHHEDAHPTAEGHEVIAHTVLATGMIHPIAARTAATASPQEPHR